MTLKELLTLPKEITYIGEWGDKKMPKTNSKFPLSKSRGLRFGSGWRWMVIEFKVVNTNCRLLIAYHPNKQNYEATLGVLADGDVLVLSRLEYHSTHPGWHVHGCCKDIDKSNVGRLKYPDMKRVPDGKSFHRRNDFGITGDSAIRPAIEFYRLEDALKNRSPLGL